MGERKATRRDMQWTGATVGLHWGSNVAENLYFSERARASATYAQSYSSTRVRVPQRVALPCFLVHYGLMASQSLTIYSQAPA